MHRTEIEYRPGSPSSSLRKISGASVSRETGIMNITIYRGNKIAEETPSRTMWERTGPSPVRVELKGRNRKGARASGETLEAFVSYGYRSYAG